MEIPILRTEVRINVQGEKASLLLEVHQIRNGDLPTSYRLTYTKDGELDQDCTVEDIEFATVLAEFIAAERIGFSLDLPHIKERRLAAMQGYETTGIPTGTECLGCQGADPHSLACLSFRELRCQITTTMTSVLTNNAEEIKTTIQKCPTCLEFTKEMGI